VGESSEIGGQDLFAGDGYFSFRQDGHAVVKIGSLIFPLIVGFEDVRSAALDWETFTSDTPFEVPIPHEHAVRPVRQLPIECDPPDHYEYRSLTAKFFSRRAVDSHVPVVRGVVDRIIESAIGDSAPLEVLTDLGLPVVNHGLAAVLGQPAADAELWLRWGMHVFDSPNGGKSANDELNDYLEHAVRSAVEHPDDNFFGALATSRFRGQPLTTDEMLGFGNLVFAGGRDTVAAAIGAMCGYLASNPTDWRRLKSDPALRRSAVEEILRLSSPLPFIGRHATRTCTHAGAAVEEGDLVALGFAAANRDPSVFDQPNVFRVDRSPNRHMAFGHGPHTCVGGHLARMEIGVTLERLLIHVEELELAEPVEQRILKLGGQRIKAGLQRVLIRLHSNRA
jgi:cytochrome P450